MEVSDANFERKILLASREHHIVARLTQRLTVCVSHHIRPVCWYVRSPIYNTRERPQGRMLHASPRVRVMQHIRCAAPHFEPHRAASARTWRRYFESGHLPGIYLLRLCFAFASARLAVFNGAHRTCTGTTPFLSGCSLVRSDSPAVALDNGRVS